MAHFISLYIAGISEYERTAREREAKRWIYDDECIAINNISFIFNWVFRFVQMPAVFSGRRLSLLWIFRISSIPDIILFHRDHMSPWWPSRRFRPAHMSRGSAGAFIDKQLLLLLLHLNFACFWSALYIYTFFLSNFGDYSCGSPSCRSQFRSNVHCGTRLLLKFDIVTVGPVRMQRETQNRQLYNLDYLCRNILY